MSARKRKRNYSEAYDTDAEDEVESEVPAAKQMKSGERLAGIGDWSERDMDVLFSRIKEALPENDTMEFRKRARSLNWDRVAFDDHSAKDCQTAWNGLLNSIRKHRTMSELLEDGRTWLKKPIQTRIKNHPEKPKKPLSPYFVFLTQKYARFAKKNPGLPAKEVQQKMADTWREMSDKKKQKYSKIADSYREDYEAQLQEFKEKHPEFYVKKDGVKNATFKKSMAPRLPTPFILYVDHRFTELQEQNPSITRKEAVAKCRKRWKKMKETKKMTWISQAVETYPKYQEELEKFCKEYPNYKVNNDKSLLNKEEIRIKDEHDGKPKKPPVSGYAIYVKEKLQKQPQLDFGAIAKMWKDVEDKQSYKDRHEEMLKEYKEKMMQWVERLPANLKRQVIAEEKLDTKRKKKKKLIVTNFFTVGDPEESSTVTKRKTKTNSVGNLTITDTFRKTSVDSNSVPNGVDARNSSPRTPEQFNANDTLIFSEEKPNLDVSFKDIHSSAFKKFVNERKSEYLHLMPKERKATLKTLWNTMTANQREEYEDL